MNRWRQLGAFLLLLIVATAPAVACAMPASHAASACCRPVHQPPCGMMQMQPVSNADCCVQPANPAAHNVALTTPALAPHAPAHLSVRLSATEIASLEAAAIASRNETQYATPKSPPGTNSILRI